MTKEEFMSLKAHTRIKYIGTDATVLAFIEKQGPKTAKTKGIVFGHVYDYSTSAWGGDKTRGIVMTNWSMASFSGVKPEDWVVVDANRKDLVHNRERRNVRQTDAYVRRELQKFSDEFRQMKSTKDRIDTWLEGVPLADRFNILTTLSEEQKAWLQLVSMDPEEVIATIKRIANEDPVDAPAEVTDGSNGPDVSIPSETSICPS